MRILFISPYVPSKIRVRPYNWIKYLAAQGHQVTLLSLTAGPDDEAALPEMTAVCERVRTVPHPRWRPLWNGLRALPSREPFQLAYSRLPAMDRLIEETIATSQFDVAHIEHLRAACFAPALRRLPVIYDAVDSISLLFERTLETSPSRSSRLMAGLDLKRTKNFEGQVLQLFERVLVTSPDDAEQFRHLAPTADHSKLKILPNGVDLDYFSFSEVGRKSNVMLFSGKMSYHANMATALYLHQEILPLIWQQRPQVQLEIVGKDPGPSIQAMANDKRITVTGSLPDIRPHLHQATISVSPLRYSVGIQNKILEAMACGLPVVTTLPGCKALATENGRHLLAADSPTEFAQQVLTLLNSPALYQTLVKEGRRYVEVHHNWHSQTSRLVEVYQEAIEEAARHAQGKRARIT